MTGGPLTGRRGIVAIALAAFLAVPGGASAWADEVEIDVEIPAVASDDFEVSDAQLRWGLNEEAGSGAFAGGCNFLSAGAVGDTGGSKVWTAEDGFFRTSAGAVTITKPVATSRGTENRPLSFAERCKDASGRTVSTASLRGTGVQAVIDGGKGSVDPASGDAMISWRGSVTVVFYGGMTSWWFTDPVLELSDGKGTLSATASGYGTSRDDMTQWEPLTPTTVVLAELAGVSLRGAKGFSALPAYLGVKVSLPADAPSQVREGTTWGSFPQSFVDFQEGTGQQAFWYSSGGARDGAKPASRLVVSYDADEPEDVDPREPDEDEQDAQNPVKPPPAPTPVPPPAVSPPPGAGSSVGGAGSTPGVPSAVPAVTVLPLAARATEPGSEALAATGGTETFPLAIASLLAGIALTALGYRSRWLVWPGRSKGAA